MGSWLDDLLDALALQARSAEQLERPQLAFDSRCPGWTVRQVLNRSVGVTCKSTEFAAGATDAPRSPLGDLLGADPALAVLAATECAATAWAQADMTRRCRLPFGTFPAEVIIGLSLFDVLAHTWDVAAAVGLPLACDDNLWAVGLDAAREVIGPRRDGRQYGPELAIGTDATSRQRFLAFLGRSE